MHNKRKNKQKRRSLIKAQKITLLIKLLKEKEKTTRM